MLRLRLPLPCARGSTMPSGNAEDRSGITQSSQYLCCFSAWFDCNFKCRWWHNNFVHCFHFCLFFQIFIPAFPKRYQFDSGSLTKSSLFSQDQDQTSVRIREPNLIGGLHCLLHWVLVLPEISVQIIYLSFDYFLLHTWDCKAFVVLLCKEETCTRQGWARTWK